MSRYLSFIKFPQPALTGFLLVITLLLTILFSCNLNEDPANPQGEPPAPDSLECSPVIGPQQVIFNSLAVGQKSRFVFFTGENYPDTSDYSIQYHPDTLIMEIIDKVDTKFRVRECITSGSQAHGDLLFPDSVLYYYLSVENGYLRPRRAPENTSNSFIYSRLFITREIPLPLEAIDTEAMQLVGWKTAPPNFGFYKEGFCESCELLGRTYPHLNFVIDNTDMATDGWGQTWVYATNGGLVRFFFVSPWTNAGSGWDLLPD